MVLVSDSPAGHQRLFDQMSDANCHADLVINTKKRYIFQQPCTPDTHPFSLHVEDVTVANVNQYTYLDTVLNNTLHLTSCALRCIHIASAAFGRLNTDVLLNKNINIRSLLSSNGVKLRCTNVFMSLAFNKSLAYTSGTRFDMMKYVAEQTARHSR